MLGKRKPKYNYRGKYYCKNSKNIDYFKKKFKYFEAKDFINKKDNLEEESNE